MDCRSMAAGDGGGDGGRISRSRTWSISLRPSWGLLLSWLLLAVSLASWPAAAAMRPDRVRDLRRETVQMFYHGFDNYMKIAFPEDEV